MPPNSPQEAARCPYPGQAPSQEALATPLQTYAVGFPGVLPSPRWMLVLRGPGEAPSVGPLTPVSPHYLVAFQSSSRDPTASRSSHMVVSVSFPPVSTKHCPVKAVVASGGSIWWRFNGDDTSAHQLIPPPQGPALPQRLPQGSQALQHRIPMPKWGLDSPWSPCAAQQGCM